MFSFVTLSRALRAWRRFASLQPASRALKALAAAHLRARVLAGCTREWRARAGHLASKAERARSVKGHMALRRRGSVLLSWHAVSVFVQSNRRAACLVLATLAQGMARERAGEGLRAWKVGGREKARGRRRGCGAVSVRASLPASFRAHVVPFQPLSSPSA